MVNAYDTMAETFWTYWPQGKDFGKLMLLNMDWTEKGGQREVAVITPAIDFRTCVREREVTIINYLPFGAMIQHDSQPHIEMLDADFYSAKLRIHAIGQHKFTLHTALPDIEVTTNGKQTKLTRSSTCWSFNVENCQLTTCDCCITVGKK